MDRRTLLCLAGSAALGIPHFSKKAHSAPATLRAVRTPTSLQKVCEELSRRYGARIFVDPVLADPRVLWAFNSDPSLETILARLAELTDSRITARTGASGTRRFTLERPVRTTQLEQTWRTAALKRSFQELLRASSDYERGKLDTTTFSRNIRFHLEHFNRAPQLKCLTRLTPEQIHRLLAGEELRFPPGAMPEAEIHAALAEYYRRSPYPPDHIQKYKEDVLEAVRRDGTGLRIDFNRGSGFSALQLILGKRGGTGLCQFGDEELGLPLTHSNPYRLLEAGLDPRPTLELPAAFRQPLAAPLVVTQDVRWSRVIAEFARVAHLDVVSDGYLSRRHSRPWIALGPKRELVPAGTTRAEALDLLCQRYGYLWWPQDGCVYLRARAWSWDIRYELPDRVLDLWVAVAKRGGGVGPAEISALATLTPLQLNGFADLGREDWNGFAKLDLPGVREFLAFFRASPRQQQALLLDRGVRVTPEQAAPFRDLLLPLAKPFPSRPFLLRLTPRVEVDAQAVPPTTKVILKLDAPREPVFGKSFGVEIPQFPEPFAP